MSTTDTETEEAARLGRALVVLRTRQGLSQDEVGARLGMTGAGYGRYETGRAAGIFRPGVQSRLTAAIGTTLAALQAELVAQTQGPQP